MKTDARVNSIVVSVIALDYAISPYSSYRVTEIEAFCSSLVFLSVVCSRGVMSIVVERGRERCIAEL